MRGRHMIKSWSSTQKSITLSSAEAELVAAVKTATEVIGVTQMAADWGWDLEGQIFVDSSAALGIVHRKGNGRLRHVRVGSLWIQEKVEDEELSMKKIEGEKNPADLLTKNLNAAKRELFMPMISQKCEVGKSDKSLELAT